MTDDLPVDHHGAPARPERRVSDDERDRVTQVLAIAAGEGRLTAGELDERLEAALTARTSNELAALTADLPEVGWAASAKEVVRIDSRGGTARRRGRWIVPRRLEIRAGGGSVKLDFTDAVIIGSTLDIQAEVRGGRLILVTRPGIEVDIDDFAAPGGRVRVRPERVLEQSARLVIKLSGEAEGGDVLVRRQRTVARWAGR